MADWWRAHSSSPVVRPRVCSISSWAAAQESSPLGPVFAVLDDERAAETVQLGRSAGAVAELRKATASLDKIWAGVPVSQSIVLFKHFPVVVSAEPEAGDVALDV